jgi:hypothetical protein
MSQRSITGYLQTEHPEGKLLYAEIERLKALKAKEEAINRVKQGSTRL